MKANPKTVMLLYQELQLARQCMDYQGIECKNNECNNIWCPLHKRYDK